MKLKEINEARILPGGPPKPPDYLSVPAERRGRRPYDPYATGPDDTGQEITKAQLTDIRKRHREAARQIEQQEGLATKTMRRNSELHRGKHRYAGSSTLTVELGYKSSKKEALQMAYALAKQYNIPYDWEFFRTAREWAGNSKNQWVPAIYVRKREERPVNSKTDVDGEGNWRAIFSARERGKRIFGF